MELELQAIDKTENTTISRLMVNGDFECFILEDVDRGLQQDMSIEEITAKKIYAKTAIPAGRYKVIITPSNRFKRDLPLLVDVPGYDGVRIHPGNCAADTAGCLLPGVGKADDMVLQSRSAFNELFPKIELAIEKKETVFITIKR